MKKIFYALALLSYVNTNTIEKTKLQISSIDEIETSFIDKAHLVTPAFQNPIHASDLSASANPQYSIKSSGRYYVANNLTQEHNTAGGIILLINANNVSLDLNNKSITPHISGSLSTGTGIAAAKGKNNIQVMNGSINAEDSSGNQKLNVGIDVSETSVSGGSGTSYSIKLNNLYITRCKLTGIDADTVNDMSVENCTANDVNGTSSCRGALFSTVNNLTIKNCEFNNTYTTGFYSEGARFSSCENCIIENTSACGNSGSSGGTSGVYVSGGSDLTFKNVTLSSNNSSSSSARGISVLNAPLIKLEGCIANNNNSTGGSVSGIYLSGSGTNCSLIDCQAHGNNTDTQNAYGVFIQQNNTLLKNVTATGNTSSDSSPVYGFYISRSDNTFINCHAQNNSNTNTSGSSLSDCYGFFITGADRNNFSNCSANSNKTSGAASGIVAAGFYSTGGNILNKFKDCAASSNQASNTGNGVTAAGFMFNGAETRSQIVNCKIENNLVGDGSTSDSDARAYGIYFDSTTGADQCQVKNCYMNNNSVSSSGLAFGFYDNDTSSTSLLIGNVSLGHGKCLGSTLDSSLQWNGDSEPASSQNFFFKHGGTGSDPRNAINEVPRENFVSLSTSVLKWMNISVYDA